MVEVRIAELGEFSSRYRVTREDGGDGDRVWLSIIDPLEGYDGYDGDIIAEAGPHNKWTRVLADERTSVPHRFTMVVVG